MGLVAGRLRPDGDVAASAARLDGHCNHALLAHPWLIDLAMSGVGHWGLDLPRLWAFCLWGRGGRLDGSFRIRL